MGLIGSLAKAWRIRLNMAIASSWSALVDNQFGLMAGRSDVSADTRLTLPREVVVIRTPKIAAYWYPSLGWLFKRLEKFPTYPAPEIYCRVVS